MDFFAKSQPETSNSFTYPTTENDETLQLSVQDSITSLMNMADKMEALLPPEMTFDFPTEQLSDEEPPVGQNTKPLPVQGEIVTSTKSETTIHSLDHSSSVSIDPNMDISSQHCSIPNSLQNSHPMTQTSVPQAAIITGLHPGTASLSTSVTISGSYTPVQAIQTSIEHSMTLAPMCVPAMPTTHVTPPPPPPPPPTTDVSMPFPAAPSIQKNVVPDVNTERSLNSGNDVSPVAVRDIPQEPSRITKPRKTPRKPKTYSKPVASRFCHICSRMPRRGQGSATCRRMSEGFCRKIVCEQCIREQGWNYEKIMADPGSWLCPHCADICPARSQCHIYNRINARRKKTGSVQKQTASVAAAISTPELVLGQYGQLLNESQVGLNQILQPPPNFRLNLPPQYSQL